MKFAEFQKFVKFAKKQKIQKLKLGAMEFEFSGDAFVVPLAKDTSPDMLRSLKDERDLWYSVPDHLNTESN